MPRNNVPTASILIPIKNEEKYLDTCLESIAKQTFADFECILVDDGSTDGTLSLLEFWKQKDKRFKFFINPNPDLTRALQFGLNHCRGKYLIRIDGDDIMPQNRLQVQVKELQNLGTGYLHTGKIQYFTELNTNTNLPENLNISTGYTQYQSWLNSISKHTDFIFQSLKECPVAAPSWAMATDEVRALGGFEENVYPDDYNFMLRALLRGKTFFKSSELVLFWRHHEKRTSLISDKYNQDSFYRLKAKHLIQWINTFASKRKIWILGTGKSAKLLVKNIKLEEVNFQGFIGIHPGKIGKLFFGHPIVHYEDSIYQDDFILVAAGEQKAQTEIARFLKMRNFNFGSDFIPLC